MAETIVKFFDRGDNEVPEADAAWAAALTFEDGVLVQSVRVAIIPPEDEDGE